jgi:SAM-dependent methyltransferase
LADFNDHALSYSETMKQNIGWTGVKHDALVAAKANLLKRLLRKHVADPASASILDVGCGIGLVECHLQGVVGQLHGIDVSAESVRAATAACPKGQFSVYDGNHIPFADESFDLVFAICVVHHVPPQSWNDFTGEMARVLRPGGLAVIIEHNPYNPVTRHMVKHCPFDHDAVLINLRRCEELLRRAALRLVKRSYITFIPVASPAVQAIEELMGWLPLGAQYVLAAKKS